MSGTVSARPARGVLPERRRAAAALAAFVIAGSAHGPRHAAAAVPASVPAAAETLTVAECIALARRSAPELQALAAERDAAMFDAAAARANRWPTFEARGHATVAPPGGYDPVVTDAGGYDLLAAVDLPLADGGARRRERARGDAAALAATQALAVGSRDAAVRIADVIADLLRQQETAHAGGEAMAWLDRLASVIASGVRGGARSRSDAVRVQIERDAAEAGADAAQIQADALARELSQALGRDALAPTVVRPPTPAEDRAPTAADSAAVVAAAEDAPDVRAAEAEVTQQRLALDEARRRSAFDVGLSADVGFAGADLSHAVPPELRAVQPDATLADRLRHDFGASVSVQFRRPLFDPARAPSVAAREAGVRAAQARVRARRADRRRAALDVIARWRTGSRRLTLAEAAHARAEEHALRSRSLYEGGGIALLELLDARRQLDEARTRLADARFDSREARLEAEILR